MTYEQAKDQIAKEMNFKDFEGMIQAWRHEQIPYSFILSCMDQAHEITADSVAREAWDRACEVQRKRTYEVLGLSSKSFLYPRDYDKLVEWMESGAKPEYQPK